MSCRGAALGSGGGLLLPRELDSELGLTDMAASQIADTRAPVEAFTVNLGVKVAM